MLRKNLIQSMPLQTCIISKQFYTINVKVHTFIPKCTYLPKVYISQMHTPNAHLKPQMEITNTQS